MRHALRALLVNREHRCLFVQHDERLASDRGKWSTPGGGIEPGEDHRSALVRELNEEFGAEFGARVTIGPFLRTNERPTRVDHFYVVWFEGDDVTIMAPDEADVLELFFGFEAELGRQALAVARDR